MICQAAPTGFCRTPVPKGIIRWEVDIEQFYALVDDMASLEDKEKMALLDNSAALLRARKLSLEDYMLVLTKLLNESHPLVLAQARQCDHHISASSNVTEDNAAAFARFVNAKLGHRFEEIGIKTRDDDSETMIQLRPRLVRLLGQYGANPEVVAAAAEARICIWSHRTRWLAISHENYCVLLH